MAEHSADEGRKEVKKADDGKNWYEYDRACRPAGKKGYYEHVPACIWKDCCARYNMNFPKQGNIRSVRGVIQGNSIEIRSPRRR